MALALAAGLVTQDWYVALPLGITLELFWLDVIALGGIIHPFAGMAFLLVFPICSTLAWSQPSTVMFPLFMAVLAGQLGAFTELRFRIRSNRLLEQLSCTGAPAAGGRGAVPCTPEKMVRACIVGRLVWHTALYAACYLVMTAFICLLLENGLYPTIPGLPWTFVYAAALVGAVLSLRERHAYMAFTAGCVIVAAIGIAWGGEVAF